MGSNSVMGPLHFKTSRLRKRDWICGYERQGWGKNWIKAVKTYKFPVVRK